MFAREMTPILSEQLSSPRAIFPGRHKTKCRQILFFGNKVRLPAVQSE
jgi:hypothetical protein